MARQEGLKDKAKGLDVEGSARSTFEQEKTDLQEMLELKMISEDQYRQYTLDNETLLKEQLMALDEERFAAQSLGHELMINSLNDMGAHATNAFMQFASGAQTGKEAVIALGQAIGQSVIRAIVDMGVQMAINAVKEKLFAAQSVATSAAASASIAATSSATGATIAAAYTTAATMVSLASFGANAAPAMAGMSATAALGKSLAAFGGGRQYGGGVDAGKFYKVNEGGKPEIFKGSDGNQYMMPNQRGEVVSNKEASGGAAGGNNNVTVNLFEDASKAGRSERDESGNISVYVANIMQEGELYDAMSFKFGMQGVGR